MSDNVPGGAIVIGGDYQGLGIVRSLGRHGVPVCVIDDEPSVSRWSRYASRTIRVADTHEEEATIAALLDAVDRFGMRGWLVFPTRDETVASLARNRKRLSDAVRVATPDWECVKYACDKRETYRLAAKLGLPIPQTWFPQSVADLAEVDVFPAVVKPALKDRFVRATGAKAWRADSPEELEDVYLRAADIVGPSESIVQELVPGGPGTIFGFCAHFSSGQVIGRMAVRYGRQHPPDFGRSATWVQTIALPEIDEQSTRFLEAISYRGLVEMEYKYDARDRTYRLLDVNARTWGYHALGARVGVDFPYLLYQDEVGATPHPVRAPGGVGWVRLATDVPTVIEGLLRRRISFRDYLTSMKHVRCESVFSARDPLPSFAEAALLPHLYITRSWIPRRTGRRRAQ